MTSISIARNGSICQAIVSTRSRETSAVMNRTSPIGGVASPTVTLTHITTAKCNGCMPKSINIGPKTGPNTNMAGPASRNMPMISSTMLRRRSSIRTLSVIPNMRSAIIDARPETVMIHAKVTDAPTSSRITPDCITTLPNLF